MSDAAIESVRRFNRTVTQRVGALSDRYLSRSRPLGEARVLWEIGEFGCDVRVLRAKLDLDSGYLSRLLRSLKRAGLITLGVSDHDKRVRRAALTRRGMAERAVLEERSEALARSLLDPLTEAQRERLVAAMDDVERLLTAALVEIDAVDPATKGAQHCLRAYFTELDERFDAGFDPSSSLPADLDEMRPPAGVFLVASLHGEPIGCGALKFHRAAATELKRMWVAPSARGLGVGRRLLAELERHAAANGQNIIHLETNRTLIEAIAMYRSAGYRDVAAFNDERYADHWFEKDLAEGSPARTDSVTSSSSRAASLGTIEFAMPRRPEAAHAPADRRLRAPQAAAGLSVMSARSGTADSQLQRTNIRRSVRLAGPMLVLVASYSSR